MPQCHMSPNLVTKKVFTEHFQLKIAHIKLKLITLTIRTISQSSNDLFKLEGIG